MLLRKGCRILHGCTPSKAADDSCCCCLCACRTGAASLLLLQQASLVLLCCRCRVLGAGAWQRILTTKEVDSVIFDQPNRSRSRCCDFLQLTTSDQGQSKHMLAGASTRLLTKLTSIHRGSTSRPQHQLLLMCWH